METVKVRFADGTSFNAEKNGDCLITNEAPTIPSDLSVVEIIGEDTKTIEHAQYIECASVDGRCWFSFAEIPAEVRERNQMQANIEYIAMMTDVDLEEA